MKPDKELTADKVYDLFPYWDSELYDYRIRDYDNSCGLPDFRTPPFIPRRGPIFRPWFRERDRDVSTIFQGLRLKILTSAEIKRPVKCVDLPVVDGVSERSRFPILFGSTPVEEEPITTQTGSTAKKE
ncbi:unnamed protein product, partial [Staurois parvus]